MILLLTYVYFCAAGGNMFIDDEMGSPPNAGVYACVYINELFVFLANIGLLF